MVLHADRSVLRALRCGLSGLAAQTQTILGFLDGLRHHEKNGANNAADVYADFALMVVIEFAIPIWFVYNCNVFFTLTPANRRSNEGSYTTLYGYLRAGTQRLQHHVQ